MKKILLVLSILVFVVIGAVMSGAGEARTAKVGPRPTPTPSAESFETVKEFLLTSAATDFHEHQPPYPAKFRKVKIGHIGDTTKSGAWRLCGEFLPSEDGDKAEWIGFATIKTSGYEQYIGSATTYCTHKDIIWDNTNLSTPLKKKLDR